MRITRTKRKKINIFTVLDIRWPENNVCKRTCISMDKSTCYKLVLNCNYLYIKYLIINTDIWSQKYVLL